MLAMLVPLNFIIMPSSVKQAIIRKAKSLPALFHRVPEMPAPPLPMPVHEESEPEAPPPPRFRQLTLSELYDTIDRETDDIDVMIDESLHVCPSHPHCRINTRGLGLIEALRLDRFYRECFFLSHFFRHSSLNRFNITCYFC